MTQTSIRRQGDAPPRPGTCLGSGHDVGRIAGGRAAKLVTLVLTAVNSTLYTLTVGGYDTAFNETTETITFTSDASATVAEVRDGIIAAIKANANAYRRVNAYDSGNDAVIEGRTIGDAFTYSDSDANIAATTTTAASAGSDIPFGYGVCDAVIADEVGLPEHTNAVAQVTTLTPTAVNTTRYLLNLVIDEDADGVPETSYPFEFVSDGSATAAEIVDGLVADINGHAQVGAEVTAANVGDTLQITSDTAGKPFHAGPSADAEADWTIAATTANVAASLTRTFVGVAGQTSREADLPGQTESKHAAGQTLPLRYEGPVAVAIEPGVSPAIGQTAYLRTLTSGTKKAGMFTSVFVAGETVAVPEVKWTDHFTPGDWSSTERTAPAFIRAF